MMREEMDGVRAFPRPSSMNTEGVVEDEAQEGMTLRDWFAG